jgi:hypothetical protein
MIAGRHEIKGALMVSCVPGIELESREIKLSL